MTICMCAVLCGYVAYIVCLQCIMTYLNCICVMLYSHCSCCLVTFVVSVILVVVAEYNCLLVCCVMRCFRYICLHIDKYLLSLPLNVMKKTKMYEQTDKACGL